MACCTRFTKQLRRGKDWIKAKMCGTEEPPRRGITISAPTDFRREDFTFPHGDHQSEENMIMLEKAKADAEQIHRESKMDKMKSHVRKVSGRFSGSTFQGDI